MTVDELCAKLNLEKITACNYDRTVDNCYCGDLLSHCMSNIKSNNIWITVQTNINIVAIAVLTELSCIIIAQDMPIDEKVVSKAASEGVAVMRSEKTTYELCVEVGNLI